MPYVALHLSSVIIAGNMNVKQFIQLKFIALHRVIGTIGICFGVEIVHQVCLCTCVCVCARARALFCATDNLPSMPSELLTFRDRIPMGGEIFRSRPDRPWGPPSLLQFGYRTFPRGKSAGAWR